MGRNSESLKPWPKGVSGNPGGRPRKKLIDYALEELLGDNDSELAVAIAKKLLARAKKGEVKAIQLIAERIEGKPQRQAEFTLLAEREWEFAHMRTRTSISEYVS